MSHNVQSTYNDVDVESLDTTELFALGAFVRFDSDTQVTVICTSDTEEQVRKIILNKED
jgi:hypothetical protein